MTKPTKKKAAKKRWMRWVLPTRNGRGIECISESRTWIESQCFRLGLKETRIVRVEVREL